MASARLMLCASIAASLAGAEAWAGPPPPSCRPPVDLNCPLASDLVAFKLNDPTGYEILAHISRCDVCDPAGANITFRGELQVQFGPYDPAITLCPSGSDIYRFPVNPAALLAVGSGAGQSTKYVPVDQTRAFQRDAGQPALRTACVTSANLDVSFPNFALIGNLGARTPSFEPPVLTLPATVRGKNDAGALTASNTLPSPFSFKQNVQFLVTATKAAGSPFRYWPDGLPIRFGPGQITYGQDQVSFTTPGAPGGPTAYQFVVESSTANTNIPLTSLVNCASANCTTTVVHNGSYLAGAWTPSATSFTKDGLDATLTLPATGSGNTVRYEPVFPRGLYVTLNGGATIAIQDSAIASGTFTDGQVALSHEHACPSEPSNAPAATLELETAFGVPVLKPDGLLEAGIENLTPGANTVLWSFNEATDLGCGTLFIPPVNTDRGPPGFVYGPQREWLQSAVNPALGRGLYAGVNYNRDGVCVGGSAAGALCQTNAGCSGGGSCDLARFAPRCGPLAGHTPGWEAEIDGDASVGGTIVPGQAGHEDREMVFVARRSGVSGVFDLGDVAQPIGDGVDTFALAFDRFGIAFRGSDTEGQDTLVRGTLDLPWPADTTLPFDRLTLCCQGQPRHAGVTDAASTHTLGYWDADFDPFALDFLGDAGDQCTDTGATECSPSGTAAKVCIHAKTPVPHFAPVPLSVFGMLPDGQADDDGIVPYSTSRFELDGDGTHNRAPYIYQIESFGLSSWDAECDGTEVRDPGNSACPYGYYDARGELSLPLFGLSDAGLMVQRQKREDVYRADLHEYGTDPDTATTARSSIPVLREMAGGSIDLAFRLDYFTPSETVDLDGNDSAGRGIFLGFQPDLNLGALETAAGVVIDPGSQARDVVSDFGPAGVMRLWGNLSSSARGRLSSIVDTVRLDTPDLRTAYDHALARVGGAGRSIPRSDEIIDLMHDTGAIGEFDLCGTLDVCPQSPDFLRNMNVGDVNLSPRTLVKGIAGQLGLSQDLEVPEIGQVQADIASLAADGQEFFAFARGTVDVERYVREAGSSAEQAITQLGRKLVPDVPAGIKLPGKQDIDFPDIPGLEWDFDYDTLPALPFFRFNSLTGSLDLTKGGLSGLGFNELSATLKFWSDGDWYFQADADIDLNQVAADGHVLLGNTKDMEPLRNLDPDVASFLGEIPAFDGAYLTVGVRRQWVNLGCLLRVRVGVDVGGWYLQSADSFGGKLGGWVDGRGACLVSVKGELEMIGGQIGDVFKLQGEFWNGGGIGWDCDEQSWDSPREALSDGGCYVCVATVGCDYTKPGAGISCRSPDWTCR